MVIAPSVLASLSLAQNASPGSSGNGIYRGQGVTFHIVKGKMIFEGDIALEHVDQKLPEKNLQPGGTLDYLQYRWPKVGSVYQIPYTIDPSSGDVAHINAAVSNYNSIFSSIIQWVSHSTETDYVNFKLDPLDKSGTGNSYLGRRTTTHLGVGQLHSRDHGTRHRILARAITPRSEQLCDGDVQ
jgi:hypothetical protein